MLGLSSERLPHGASQTLRWPRATEGNEAIDLAWQPIPNSWMVYKGKSHLEMDDFGGTPILGNPHITSQLEIYVLFRFENLSQELSFHEESSVSKKLNTFGRSTSATKDRRRSGPTVYIIQ